MRLLRAGVPTVVTHSARPVRPCPHCDRLLLFQEEAKGRHAVPQGRSESVYRRRDRGRGPAGVRQGRPVPLRLYSEINHETRSNGVLTARTEPLTHREANVMAGKHLTGPARRPPDRPTDTCAAHHWDAEGRLQPSKLVAAGSTALRRSQPYLMQDATLPPLLWALQRSWLADDKIRVCRCKTGQKTLHDTRIRGRLNRPSKNPPGFSTARLWLLPMGDRILTRPCCAVPEILGRTLCSLRFGHGGDAGLRRPPQWATALFRFFLSLPGMRLEHWEANDGRGR